MANTTNSRKKTSSNGHRTSGKSTSSYERRGNTNSASRSNSRNTSSRTRSQSSGRNYEREPLDTKARDEIILICSIALCIVLFLCNFHMIGLFGEAVSGFMFGIFGLLSYILPLAVALFVLFGIFNKDNPTVIRKLISIGILVFLFMIMCDMFTGLVNVSASYDLSSIYNRCSQNRNGGGILGGSFAYLFMKLLGSTGTWVLIIVLVCICIIMITGRSLLDGIKEQGQMIYEDSLEESRYRKEQSYKRKDEKRRIREEKLIEKRRINDELEKERRLKKEEIENEQILRMNKKASGVSYDTKLADDSVAVAQTGIGNEAKDDEHLIKISSAPIQESIVGSALEHSVINTEASDATREITFDENEAFEYDFSTTKARQSRYADAISSIHQNNIEQDIAVSSQADEYENTASTNDYLEIDSVEDDNIYSEVLPMQEVSAPVSVENDNTTSNNQTEDIITGSETYQAPIHMNGKTYGADSSSYGAGGAAPEASYSTEYGNTMGHTSGHDRPSAHKAVTTEKNEKPNRPVSKVYKFPPIDCLSKVNNPDSEGGQKELQDTAEKLRQTLEVFGISVKITDISRGPAVTRYEMQPELGVKVSKIVGLADDIKLSLAATDIRIEAPIPGKSAVGIEIPNKVTEAVGFRDMVESKEFRDSKASLPFAVGKDISGSIIVHDIAKMPHVLIAGSTGSGKSVCINTIIMSILYKCKPEDVKLIMIDPKVVELSVYNGIPHLLLPVVTDAKKAAGALGWAVKEMMDRYAKFADVGVRDIKGYNEQISDPSEKLAHILIIVDELADLMMVSPAEVEEYICRLAQLARACGIHVVIATQRPSVNVITGLIKANMPSRIAFAVSSGVDSRTILDSIGAEKLLGKGDMLFYPQGVPKPSRVQGAFIPDADVSKVIDHFRKLNYVSQNAQDIEEQIDQSAQLPTAASGQGSSEGNSDYDPLFAEAGRFIIDKEKASIGALQRLLRIGFNRAARIMDQLAEEGVVGEEAGTKPREILMSSAQFEELLNNLGINN